MDAQNFEMLGRYAEAKERAEKIAAERQRALWDLKALINGDHAPDDVKKIDWEQAEVLLAAARRLDGQLRQAYEDADLAAAALGRPPLGYRR